MRILILNDCYREFHMEKDKLLLKILIEGAEIWNQLRSENPQLFIDFNDADLKGANLNETKLKNADLSEADLDGASLSGADLSEANLSEARLNDANLNRADLRGADLRRADLRGADLGRAHLSKANLSPVELHGADLSGADLSGVDLSEADLGSAYLKRAYLRRADLSGAHLRGVVLRGANLTEANLSEADLNGADLSEANLNMADLSEADLNGAHLNGADLSEALLRRAELSSADLSEANLSGADLSGADFSEANLDGTNLRKANFSEANLGGVNLSNAVLIQSNLKNAKLANCRIYGISVWDVEFSKNTEQQDLIISPDGQPLITVDNLEIAQFIYLLLHNEKIRSVLDTTGKKVVLILGRFPHERQSLLEGVRNKLRKLGFIPMFFELEKPTQRDFTEKIKTLAGLSRFIIADITNPKSSPLELQAIVPDYRIPFVPIGDENEEHFSIFRNLQNEYPEWVLDVVEYDSAANLIKILEDEVVKPALKKSEQLAFKKADAVRKRHFNDYQ